MSYCAKCDADDTHDTENCPHLKEARDEVTSAADSLLPCPFCGNKPELRIAMFHGIPQEELSSWRDKMLTGCWIVCTNEKCSIKIGYYDAGDDCESGLFATGAAAAKFWNSRAS